MISADEPWVGHYPPAVSPDLCAPFPTMLAAWKHHVDQRPDAPAVHYYDATLTFAEIDRAADALACALQDVGVRWGDRVAVYLQNDPQWLVTMLAAWKVGAAPAAVNPMLRQKELTHHLVDSGAVVLVCLDHLYAGVAAEVVAATPVRRVITTHPLDMTPDVVLPDRIAAHVPARQVFNEAWDWQEVQRRYDGISPRFAPLEPGDVGVLTYTSGTTGRSKGAMNLHSAMAHSSTVFVAWWDLQPDRDVVMGLPPVFHITGMIAGFGVHILAGIPIVLLHRFDVEQTLLWIERWRATFMVAASTAFIALSNHPDLKHHDVSSLTKTPSGGAAVGPALVDRVRTATGWTLHGAYGMTETTSPTHLGPPGVDPPTDPDSGALAVGIPVPGCRVRVVDLEDGRNLGPAEIGEIVVSGPMVVPGYWRLPEESAYAIRDGWLHTGDIGKETEDGWLFVVDRLKDLINAGGYKVYPRDVEDVLYQHPAVREACVVGVPDEYRGETVKAFVSLTAGASVTPDEIAEFCKARMAAYKYPRVIEVLPELPKNASGKLLRRELRETR